MKIQGLRRRVEYSSYNLRQKFLSADYSAGTYEGPNLLGYFFEFFSESVKAIFVVDCTKILSASNTTSYYTEI